VGYIIAGIKELKAAKVGDTITWKKLPNNLGPASRGAARLQGDPAQVFAGLYPTEASEYDQLRDALEKLQLNDASLRSSPRSARRWALASAAAFWACCTWRSCRSAWSASSTRT
jgi:translation elongation factor EF-4